MPAGLPRSRKPPEQLRRRNAPESWTVLPSVGCKLSVPKWPCGKPSAAEAALWRRLWTLPIACWWHDQRVEPFVVASYVSLALAKPEHATVMALARELGLTPASLQRMRLIVEAPEPVVAIGPDPYAHLRVAK